MFRTLLTSASLLALTSTASFAVCVPDPAADFDSVSCIGTITDAFESDANFLEVIVIGDITTAGDAIKVEGDGNTVNVLLGASVDGGDEAIVGGMGLTVINDGDIFATDKAIDADNLDDVSVFNTGRIFAGDKGIRIGDGANAILDNIGIIESSDEGFEAGVNATIANLGLISANGDDAVQIGDDGLILNGFGAIIESINGGDGIDIDSGVIENDGAILAFEVGEAAIDVDGGTSMGLEVANTGTIQGDIGILADPANTQSQNIFNEGRIEGTGGVALDLGIGADSYETTFDGQLVGSAFFGAGDDMLILSDDLDDPFSLGAILDGGADNDTVVFGPNVSSLDIALAVLNGADDVSLTINGPLSTYSMRLVSWELFSFSNGDFTLSELTTTPVPVPAPLAMLGVALLGLGAAGRRRKG